ncbi:craniofacial development protein 2-like [Capsicum annuum]|uniref:craniofacial development protein 2-like n=1 Tax=Capsicum annuum TaxID=4072 RepID=UPI001FB10E3C|nr:craniofacial development protein 2-like [Capsicum annuum]
MYRHLRSYMPLSKLLTAEAFVVLEFFLAFGALSVLSIVAGVTHGGIGSCPGVLGVGSRAGVGLGLSCGGRGSKARHVDGYKLWHSGSDRLRNGIGILVDEELRGQVGEVNRVSDRVVTIKLVFGGFTLNICCAYAPHVGLDEEEKKSLWEVLDEVVRGVPSSEKIFLGGNFNGHIGSLPLGYDDVHRGFGFEVRNGEGVALLEFARTFGLVVVNFSFPKKEKHLVTFRSRLAKTQIDFLLLRKGNIALCKDCKVIPSENLTTQHRLLVMDLAIKKGKKRRGGKGPPRIRWG